MRLTLNTNMELFGLREPYKATYKVSYKIPPHLTGLLKHYIGVLVVYYKISKLSVGIVSKLILCTSR